MREETDRKRSTRSTVTSVVAASELALCADGLLAASGSGAAAGTAWTTLTVDRMVSESTTTWPASARLDVTAPVQTASAATTGSDV
jgi:hypothetical protein